jgi:hypothetical protein
MDELGIGLEEISERFEARDGRKGVSHEDKQ